MWRTVLVLTVGWGAFAQQTTDAAANAGEDKAAARSVTELLQAAAVHTVHNRHSEAEECYREILRVENKEAGQEDSATALTASYLLAVAVRRQGRWEEAFELFETALRKQQSVLEPVLVV